MRQITPADATFYYVEGDNTYAHGTFTWFYDGALPDGGQFDFKDLVRHLQARLHVSNILTQKLVPVPLHLDYPYWVDDPDFDFDYHVRHIKLKKPGNWAQFQDELSAIHSVPLSMDRPMWEIHCVTGLDDVDWLPKGAFALIAKFHHVAIDGATGMSIISGLHDTAPTITSRDEQPRSTDVGDEEPGLGHMLLRAAVNNIRQPLNLVKLAGGLIRDLPKVLPHVRLSDVPDLGKAPDTPFNRSVSDTRVFDTRFFPLDDIKQMRRSVSGATFNDVVLTLCAGGLRKYLESVDGLPDETLIAGCPINVRSEEEADSGGNRIAAMISKIHTDIADPKERLRAITRSTKKAKATVAALGARRLMEISDSIPAPTLFTVTRLRELLPSGSGDRRVFNCPVSNLPGPQVPLYLDGARLLHVSCAMPVMDGHGLFLGALTYDGSLCIAITSTDNILPNPDELGEAMAASFAEMQEALGESDG